MGSRRGGAGMAREAKRSAAAAGTAWVFFMAVCLCSAGTSRGAGLVLGMLALSGVFFHYERVRGRLRGPMLALALVAAADGMSCLYAASGKFALFEYLKVFTALCLAVLVLALAEGEDADRRVCGMLEGFAALAGLVSIDLLSTRWVSGAVLGVVGWFTQDYTQLAAVEEGVRMTSVFMSPNVFAGCMGIGVLLSLGLAVTEERAWARGAHVACLAVSSLSFVLAFSMGGCATIVPAFAVLLALTGKGRRMELLKWADGGKDRYLIEDDYDSEFRFRGKPIPALLASDRHGRVIYMGTFSKAIAPAIRVSFLVLPEALLARYRRDCSVYSCTVSRIDQSILNQFIGAGHFERHLNKMRKIYRAKHDLLLECLADMRDAFRVSGENAGLHLLLTAKGGMGEGELVRRAAERGVRVYGLSESMVEEAPDSRTVLLGFGGLDERQIREGVALLREAWKGKG